MAIRFVAFAALLVVSLVSIAAEPVPLADFAKHHQFVDAKISPDGKHLAATSIIDGKRVLSFIDLADNTVCRQLRWQRNRHPVRLSRQR